ncbi:MAG: hypothetical protein ABH877_05435, partial [bacterium]
MRELDKAKVRLLVRYPFYGSLLCSLDDRPDPTCETMATDGKRLFYNPDFVKGMTRDECVAVLCHEVLHCALWHLARRGTRHPLKWNVACVTGDTRVTMTDGSEKAITQVRCGDVILGYENGRFTPTMVTATLSKVADTLVELRTPNGTLRCTSDHKILTCEGYIEAGSLLAASAVTLERVGSAIREGEPRHHDDQRDGRNVEAQLSPGRRV